MIGKDIILEDTTLRDGEQAPGIAFSRETKIVIYQALVNLGVQWIEVGIPAMGGEELDALRDMLSFGDDVTLLAWNRGVLSDVEFSLDLGFKAIHIGLPLSKIHLSASIGKDFKWLLRTAKDLVSYAKDRGAFVSISAEDVGRAELSQLIEYAGCVSEAGADRLRLSDTIGILTPLTYSQIFRDIRRACPIDLQSHAHNDFGLAVANTLAALESGAKYFHVTVNGIGERAGMPDIAQVVLALRCLYGIDLELKYSKLPEISDLVANASRHIPAPWQPIIGRNVFAHESGIHVNGIVNDEKTFEPFPASLVGMKNTIVLGKHSGKHAIQYMLASIGINPEIELLEPCLQAVRSFAIAQGKEVSVDQLKVIWQQIQNRNN